MYAVVLIRCLTSESRHLSIKRQGPYGSFIQRIRFKDLYTIITNITSQVFSNYYQSVCLVDGSYGHIVGAYLVQTTQLSSKVGREADQGHRMLEHGRTVHHWIAIRQGLLVTHSYIVL